MSDPIVVDHLSINLETFFLKLSFPIVMSLILYLTTQTEGYKADTIVLAIVMSDYNVPWGSSFLLLLIYTFFFLNANLNGYKKCYFYLLSLKELICFYQTV